MGVYLLLVGENGASEWGGREQMEFYWEQNPDLQQGCVAICCNSLFAVTCMKNAIFVWCTSVQGFVLRV